jgi:hypothetical protein
MSESFPGRAPGALARTLLLSCAAVFSVLSLAPTALQTLAPGPLQLLASARASEPLYACGITDASGQNNVFQSSEAFGIQVHNDCAQGSGMWMTDDAVNTIPPGSVSQFVTTAPPGFAIIGAYVPTLSVGSGTVGTGYIANFFWTGAPPQRVTNAWTSFNIPAGAMYSGQFGFNLECSPSGGSCPPSQYASIFVPDVQLTVAETVGPSMTALGSNNLWYKGASEYVRGGGWSIAYSASAPSGIAAMAASEAGQPIADPTAPAPGCPSRNYTVWQQCPPSSTWSPTVTLSGNGSQQLVLSATSAAASPSSPTETISVDSVQPTVSLSGPTSASSTAGIQYVTATANVGPSGLGSISCSTDGAPTQSYPSSPAQIPVSGLGNHTVECRASNRSYDSAGQVATSVPVSTTLDIAEPTASGISFANIIHGLKCRTVKERVKIPAKWVTIRRHGKLEKVHRRAHTKRVKRLKCHARIVKRKVTVLVKVKRHGKTVTVKRRRLEKVILPPRIVAEATKRVRHGRSATVHGFLATSDGVALGGRTVEVLTAPDNGLGQWSQAASVTTGADGGWTAQLPPGPSRLVEAIYNGEATTESSTSGQVRLVIPAKVELLTATPRRVAWGGTVRIVGRLLGGYLPPGGALVRLRIGSGSSSTTYGVKEHVSGTGRFSTTYTFGAGQASSYQTFWFQISSLPMGSYPFAPNDSGRRSVLVGGHPAIARHKHRARKHKRRR